MIVPQKHYAETAYFKSGERNLPKRGVSSISEVSLELLSQLRYFFMKMMTEDEVHL